jgi:REP element-mobilizing transposase RayT
MARKRQLTLDLTQPFRWGGRRAGAGRKPKHDRAGLPHAPRAAIPARHPAHVTLRVRPSVPSLRSARLVRAFERSLGQTCERGDFRVVHYSLQSNHVHLIVEAADRGALARGMIAVGSRLARAVHRVFHRSGPVLGDRYHVRALATPREVWNALRYVLLNARRHARRILGPAALDPASSARWFDGWQGVGGVSRDPRPVARARTWLLATGWRRHGSIDPADVPGPG